MGGATPSVHHRTEGVDDIVGQGFRELVDDEEESVKVLAQPR